MIIKVCVDGQSMRWHDKAPQVADNSIEFVEFQFDLSHDWADCDTVVAQFTQKTTYNKLVLSGKCTMPTELTSGSCNVSLFGYASGKPNRATVIPLGFDIQSSGFVSDGETPIPPTPDLYAQLLEQFQRTGVNPDDIKRAVDSYMEEHPVNVKETDPTVPAWAKQPQKPTYTAEEVGALPKGTPIPDKYTLPIATPDTLGGVKPVAKTDGMTQPVGIDELGGLWSVSGGGGTVSGGGNAYTYEYTVELSEDVGGFRINLPCTTDKLLMWNVVLLIPTYEGNSTDKQNLYVGMGGNANLSGVLPANSVVLTALKMGEFMKIHNGGRPDKYYANISTTMGQGQPAEVSPTQDWISFTTPSPFIFATGTKIMFWGVYAE